MKRILALLVLLCLPAAARAMWAMVPLEELVRESDLIVVGTLRDVHESSADGMDYGEGRIDVREVIWGVASAGDVLTLKWQNSSAVACPRVEHDFNANKEGIWLLTREGDVVRANYPGRFVALKERGAILKALRQSTIVLRSGDPWVGGGLPMAFEVVYRNTTNATLSFEGVGYEDGRALLPRGSRLVVKIDGSAEVNPVRLVARYTSGNSVEPFQLAPGEERRFAFDLRVLMASPALKGKIYVVNFTPPGGQSTSEIVFYEDVRENFGLAPPPPPTAPSAPKINYSRRFVALSAERGLAPLTRAWLTALGAFLLFPFFYKLRVAFASRAAHGALKWQI